MLFKNCPPNSCILHLKRKDTWLLKNLNFVQIECYFVFLSYFNFLFLGYITQKHWCFTDTLLPAIHINIQPGQYFNGRIIATLFVAHKYIDWKKVVIAYIYNLISLTLLCSYLFVVVVVVQQLWKSKPRVLWSVFVMNLTCSQLLRHCPCQIMSQQKKHRAEVSALNG